LQEYKRKKRKNNIVENNKRINYPNYKEEGRKTFGEVVLHE